MSNCIRYCSLCKKSDENEFQKFNKCSLCFRTYYCSKECQNLDWETHKKICKPLITTNICEYCKKNEYTNNQKFIYCNLCNSTTYCSKKCQENDELLHKNICKSKTNVNLSQKINTIDIKDLLRGFFPESNKKYNEVIGFENSMPTISKIIYDSFIENKYDCGFNGIKICECMTQNIKYIIESSKKGICSRKLCDKKVDEVKDKSNDEFTILMFSCIHNRRPSVIVGLYC